MHGGVVPLQTERVTKYVRTDDVRISGAPELWMWGAIASSC